MEIDKHTPCNNTKCTGRHKCYRYYSFLTSSKSNPFTFSGTKKQICTNYIPIQK